MGYRTPQFSCYYPQFCPFKSTNNFLSLHFPFRIFTFVLVITQHSSNLKILNRTLPFVVISENYCISFLSFKPYQELLFINPFQIIINYIFQFQISIQNISTLLSPYFPLCILPYYSFIHSFILFLALLKNVPISILLTQQSSLLHLKHPISQ